eukprot:16442-Heterococcus_DN1.PRE.4
MAGNGMLMAGLCKAWVLRPSVASNIRQAFVYLELLVKAVHLIATCTYLLPYGLASFGSLFNMFLSAGQLVAVLLTAKHELATTPKAQ